MEFDGRGCNHSMAMSPKKNGKILNQLATWSTPLILRVSQNLTKIDRCKLGSSIGEPKNWFRCTMDNKEGFNSKLPAFIAGRTMLELCSSFVETE